MILTYGPNEDDSVENKDKLWNELSEEAKILHT